MQSNQSESSTSLARRLRGRTPVFWLAAVSMTLLILSIGLTARIYLDLRQQTDTLRLARGTAVQTERELLRLYGLVQAEPAAVDANAVERQLQLVSSYLSGLRQEMASVPAGAAVTTRLTLLESDWAALRANTTTWLAAPEDSTRQADISREIIRLEAEVELLAAEYDALDAAQAVQLNQASRNLLVILAGVVLFFLLFLGLTGWYAYRLVQEREHTMRDRLAEQHERWQQGNALRRLYNVTSTPSLSFVEKASGVLNIGCQLFDLPLGILSEIEGDTFQTVAVQGPERRLRAEHVWNLIAIELQQAVIAQEMVTIEPVAAPPPSAAPDSIFDRWQLEKLVGVPVRVAGRLHGTLCFVGPAGRADAFSEAEREMLKLMAQWLGSELARQEAMAALLRSEEEFRHLFESAPIGMGVAALDGRILNVNDAFCRMVGYSPAELRRRRFADITHPDDIAPKLALGQEVLQGKQRFFQMENRYLSKDGQVVTTLLQTTLRRDSQGQPQDFVGQMVDITERKRAEEALWQAQKFESIGLLAGGIAHDFNNLLTVILAQNVLATRLLPAAAPAQAHLQKLGAAAERAADLTRQLLAYAGKGELDSRQTSLNDLIEKNHELFQTILGEVPLSLNLETATPSFRADPSQIQQVVMNLLINAAEAVGTTGGGVRVHTAPCYLDSDARGRGFVGGDALAPGLYASLEVADDGIGMSVETQARIFDPFFTTKETGHGLGLSATLGIIHAHKGGLAVESELGVGTTFRVLLPADPAGSPAAEERAPQTAGQHRKARVLVIDDEAPVREVVGDILALVDIETVGAGTGVEAIAVYEAQHEAIDLVLLDVQLPEMSGEAVYQALRQIDERVRVIFSSGYSDSDTVRRLFQDGQIGFLQKPYDVNSLLKKVRDELN